MQMLEDARRKGQSDYSFVLVKDKFFQPARDFIWGKDCEHKPGLLHRVNSAGRDMYQTYCAECGSKLSEFLPHKSISIAAKRTAYSQALHDEQQSIKRQCYARLREFYRAEGGWWGAYQLYLKSAHWLDLREKVLYRDGYMCQLQLQGCTQGAVQVHHLTYERITRERMSDLISVCLNCHQQQHGRIFYEEPMPV